MQSYETFCRNLRYNWRKSIAFLTAVYAHVCVNYTEKKLARSSPGKGRHCTNELVEKNRFRLPRWTIKVFVCTSLIHFQNNKIFIIMKLDITPLILGITKATPTLMALRISFKNVILSIQTHNETRKHSVLLTVTFFIVKLSSTYDYINILTVMVWIGGFIMIVISLFKLARLPLPSPCYFEDLIHH